MELNQFFAPFNFKNLLNLFIAMLFFDSLGVAISKLLDFPKFLRTAFWIFGLGIFVFVWFVLHFFLPFKELYIWVSMLALTFLTLPIYIKSGGPSSLIKEFFLFPFPLLFLLLVAKPLFYLMSQPPYIWDEMAYHFYSPARLTAETSWQFINTSTNLPSFYDMIPRGLDTAFVLIFSITKTYATARLLHFLIYLSSIFAIGRFIQKKMGIISALVFTFLVLYLSESILIGSTTGYIDTGAAVIALLSFVTLVGYVLQKEKRYIFAGTSLAGIALGIKYTTLSFLVSITLVILVVILITNINKWKKLYNKYFKYPRRYLARYKWLLLLIILPLVFGGYWYLKNVIISGNPVYPFIFQCSNNYVCGEGLSFFSGWAKTLDFQIFKNFVFQKNELLFQTTVAALFAAFLLSFTTKNISVRIFSIVTPLSIFLEFLLVKSSVGFLPRYFQHWPLLVPLVLALPLSIEGKRNKLGFKIVLIIAGVFTIFILKSAGQIANNFILKAKDPAYIKTSVSDYALNKIPIKDYISSRFSRTSSFIDWCGEKGQMKTVIIADPSIIWSSSEGLMRIFMINCNLKFVLLSENFEPANYANFIVREHDGDYILSLISCPKKELLPLKDPRHQRNAELNQSLICNKKISPVQDINENLYRIGPSTY